MDNNIAISLTNISKKYKIYNTPVDRLKEALWQRVSRKSGTFYRDFWALKEINLQIPKGTTLGIIGKNGSGKSTLLQIIAGILQPTTGEVKVNGRISTLLELGAGFHPDFTGTENVVMAGSIMGISRKEMENRFDEIAAFADIGDFIDQPVRTYSSGMYVRLAFSCAVNVDPDILIVDEAFSVGDAKFQKKCFDKMNSFKERGITIVLVSHGDIKSFVTKGILLDRGQVQHIGGPEETHLKYMQMLFPEQAISKEGKTGKIRLNSTGKAPINDLKSDKTEDAYYLEVIPDEGDEAKSFGAGGAWVNRIKIYGLKKPNIFHGGEKVEIVVSISWDWDHVQSIFQANNYDRNLLVGVAIENSKGIALTSLATPIAESNEVDIDPGKGSSCVVSFIFVMPVLLAGDYFLSPGIAMGRQENFTPLRRYGNIVNLTCIPNKRNVFGLMNWSVVIRKEGTG